MRYRTSLGLRLLAASALLVTLALVGTGFALSAIFRAHVTAQYERELTDHLGQLTAHLRLDGNGRPSVTQELSDPRFQAPYGGRYWQAERAGWPALRSRSLWDQAMRLEPDAPAPGALHRHEIEVPGIGRMLVIERLVRFASAPEAPIRLAVALPLNEIDAVARRLDRLVALSLGVLAVALLAASALQVRVGLQPLHRLTRALGTLHRGAARLDGQYPAEVTALVEELNRVLAQRETMLDRARTQAADLAHGLKTSLQLLLLEADELERSGSSAGPRLREQVLRMQRIVERQLVRARAQGRRPMSEEGVAVADSLAALLRVLGPMAARRGVVIERIVPVGHRFAGDAADLEEMLGNLLDNACKWARSTVRVDSRIEGGRLRLRVEDDGPGLDDLQHAAAFERGWRLDERRPGDGLGLAIVREIAFSYGGEARLTRSSMGGLSAELDLPPAGANIGSSA